MRSALTPDKLKSFMKQVGDAAESDGTIYLTGGATALLLGIRQQTIDIDMKLDPEPKGVFAIIPKLKIELDINVELASPGDFIPVAPGWQERSIFIATFGRVAFFHFDLHLQILAKVERSFEQDLADAEAFVRRGHVRVPDIETIFAAIQADLIRYPAIDPDDFTAKVSLFLAKVRPG